MVSACTKYSELFCMNSPVREETDSNQPSCFSFLQLSLKILPDLKIRHQSKQPSDLTEGQTVRADRKHTDHTCFDSWLSHDPTDSARSRRISPWKHEHVCVSEAAQEPRRADCGCLFWSNCRVRVCLSCAKKPGHTHTSHETSQLGQLDIFKATHEGVTPNEVSQFPRVQTASLRSGVPGVPGVSGGHVFYLCSPNKKQKAGGWSTER